MENMRKRSLTYIYKMCTNVYVSRNFNIIIKAMITIMSYLYARNSIYININKCVYTLI